MTYRDAHDLDTENPHYVMEENHDPSQIEYDEYDGYDQFGRPLPIDKLFQV